MKKKVKYSGNFIWITVDEATHIIHWRYTHGYRETWIETCIFFKQKGVSCDWRTQEEKFKYINHQKFKNN